MLSTDGLLGIVMMVSLTFYALTGGADYGGGVWDLLAGGRRADKQRELIVHAIGPIWEANHVWLILVVVVLFTAFPAAFAAISISLYVPLLLILAGIVLRGSAFIFRAYDTQERRTRRNWGRLFAIPSLITPILLGVVVGAISSGGVWLAAFPLAVGLFSVVLFALLAAVYLTLETKDRALQDDFRSRAISSEFAAAAVALLVFLLAGVGAPEIRERLARSWWTWPLQVSTALLAMATLWALWTRRFGLARVSAAGQVALILWGWGLAQYPFIMRPVFTLHNSAAPESTLRPLLGVLASGALLLFPSYWYLFKVFKSHTTYTPHS